DDALNLLEAPDQQRVSSDPRGLGDRPVAFMFPGQGAQYVAMAAGLYDDEPVFHEVIDRCCELLKPHLGLDLRDLLYPDHQPTTTDQGSTTNDQRTGMIYRAPTDDQGSTTNDQRTGTI